MGLIRWLLPIAAALAPIAGHAQAPREERYVPGPGVERVTVHARSLEGNLEGNSPDRTVFVVLPASYATAKSRRYPVVYFLHGYMSSAENYMVRQKLADGLRTAEKSGAGEMILVVPDANSRHGGSMYSNSPTTGDYEGYITRDLVAFIDGRYRTIADRRARGLAGHSMGGYGTLRLGMKYPEVYSSLYAMSACCLSPRTIADPAQSKAIERMTYEETLKGGFLARADWAAAAAWSPAPDKAPMFAEVATRNGVPDPLVLARWAANAPHAMLPQYVGGLKRMTAIAIDVGDKDSLLSDDRAMHEELDRFGIANSFSVYDGDHGNRVAERFHQFVLPFFGKHLAKK